MTAEQQSADTAEDQEQAPPPEDPSKESASGDDNAADTVAAAEDSSDLATQLSERTTDLQRVTAEYHNYRKRVERDKTMAAEQVTATVVAGLLPVLDDIDRAREHGDLEGPFAAVAEQLNNALVKLGLEVFGEKGDPFDPVVHEAVAHMHSPDVTETSCVDVMRRGYRIGERLLRPAMVAVAEPAEPQVAATEVTESKPAEPEAAETEATESETEEGTEPEPKDGSTAEKAEPADETESETEDEDAAPDTEPDAKDEDKTEAESAEEPKAESADTDTSKKPDNKQTVGNDDE